MVILLCVWLRRCSFPLDLVVFFASLMRFNTQIVVVALALNSVAALSQPAGNLCAEEIIVQAAQEGFLQYVITKCVPYSGKNVVGVDLALTGSECMSNWINTHQSGSPIPNTGACRETYQEFIDDLIKLNVELT